MSSSFRLLIIAWSALTVLAACGGRNYNGRVRLGNNASILLFNGAGVSPNDVAAIETILDKKNLSYSTVNSSELNFIGQSQIMSYRLLIVPGGNFIDMGNSLTKGTTAGICYAVQHGLNYPGICAGAFLAGSSAYYKGFNFTSGVTFGFYAAANRGIRKAAVAITRPGNQTLDHYWEDGPQLSGWGKVVATYPDSTPAVTEGKYGSGFVILTGIHAEAPAEWRGGMIFNSPVNADNAYAATLINAAITGVPLPRY